MGIHLCNLMSVIVKQSGYLTLGKQTNKGSEHISYPNCDYIANGPSGIHCLHQGCKLNVLNDPAFNFLDCPRFKNGSEALQRVDRGFYTGYLNMIMADCFYLMWRRQTVTGDQLHLKNILFRLIFFKCP